MKNTARKTRPAEDIRPQLRDTLGALARDQASAQLALGLRHLVREKLREFVISAGTAALAGVLEEERTQLVGARYARLPNRRASGGGSAPGELVMGGRRVQVRRPRARTLDGQEMQLPSWTTFGAEDPLRERAVEQMLVGVSTRRYARSLEPLPAGLPERGISRSAVSRRFVAATERPMAEWLRAGLGALELGVLMIDGVHIDEHVMLVALGIDADGNKHVLGVRQGATENAAACTALLADLRDRGLHTDRAVLVVIDGGKALAKAVRSVFGDRAIVQRCQAHYLGRFVIRRSRWVAVELSGESPEIIALPRGVTCVRRSGTNGTCRSRSGIQLTGSASRLFGARVAGRQRRFPSICAGRVATLRHASCGASLFARA